MEQQQRRRGSVLWLYPVLSVFALGLLAWGVYLFALDRSNQLMMATGCLAVFGVLLVWCHSLNLQTFQSSETAQREAAFNPVNERLQHISMLLNQVSEQQLISERAKAIAFRENEREALRRAIHEEMGRRDWDAALVLANEIEAVFGYKREADKFREEILNHRDAAVRRQVGEIVATIDRCCREENWTQALREAERAMQTYPNDPQARNLPQDIETRRQGHKKMLLETWQDAVRRHDVDASIEILRKLDLYLTPAEAQTMQEQARQVFKDKLVSLGQQFTLAVKEHKWRDAIRLGETIGREFPNSRMTQEVRDKMDLLRQRAAEEEPAGV